MIEIVIIDDHPLFREAMHSVIGAAYDKSEILEAGSLDEGIAILETSKPDLILLDLNIPDAEGYFGLMDLRAKFPRLPIVVVSGHEAPRTIKEVMANGALGFIPKSTRKPVLIHAIKKVLRGEIYLPENYVEPPEEVLDVHRTELLQKLATFTPQQLRVLKMLRDGLLNKQIAYELGVGETTIKAHVSEILRKLSVYSRTQVVIEINKIADEELLNMPSTLGNHSG